MTAREVYEATLVEANKVNAPTFTVQEFNYMLNKALLAFGNERYNFYNTGQQLSDDMRVLLKTAVFSFKESPWNPTTAKVVAIENPETEVVDGVYVNSVADLPAAGAVKINDSLHVYSLDYDNISFPYKLIDSVAPGVSPGDRIFIQTPKLTADDLVEDSTTDRILSVDLPASDYFHILSVRTYWVGRKLSGTKARLTFPAKMLTYDMLNVIENNVYMRPRHSRPYFMVWDNDGNSGVQGFDLAGYKANQNRPKINIHLGVEKAGVELERVEIDYLKTPEKVVLDEVDVWSNDDDGSQVLEFPDYLLNQFVRRITDYLLEINKDPRIQTHPHLNQEIPAVPLEFQQAQAQAQQNQNQ